MVSFPKGLRTWLCNMPEGSRVVGSPSNHTLVFGTEDPPSPALGCSEPSVLQSRCLCSPMTISIKGGSPTGIISECQHRGEAGTGMNPRWARPRRPSWGALQKRQKDSVSPDQHICSLLRAAAGHWVPPHPPPEAVCPPCHSCSHF